MTVWSSRTRGSRWLGLLLTVAMVTAGCSGDVDDLDAAAEPAGSSGGSADSTEASGADADTDGDGFAADDESSGADASGASPATTVVTATGERPALEGGTVLAADLDGPTAELVTLQEEPYIGAAVYPRPDYEANPWSSWGQGIALEDGRVVVAMGDHLGADGNSFLYLYDPDERALTQFADLLSTVDHQPGSWGYGKVHSQMVDPGDGGIYFTSYYGSRRDLSFDGSYGGDILFRLDKETLDLEPLLIPVPEHGVPSLATNGAGLVYGEAVDPLADDDAYPTGAFFVYDAATGAMVTVEENPDHEVFRSVMVGLDGTAWYAGPRGRLFRYDPAAGIVTDDGPTLEPGGLRAVTAPNADGTIYGVTDEEWDLFSFRPGEEPVTIGEAPGYTTSLALVPDGSGFLYVPGAHGRAANHNAALIRVDGTSGDQETVVELLDLVSTEFGLTLGGTYSVTVDPARNHAHVAFNAGVSEDEPWGELVFVVVELP